MKLLKSIIVILMISLSLSSCATIFGGHVDECQRNKPGEGQPQRQVRVAALVLDILFFVPGVAIDFATHAIYKPCSAKGNIGSQGGR